MGDIIVLQPRPDAPIQRLFGEGARENLTPRSEFGLRAPRKAEALADCLSTIRDICAGAASDLEQQQRIKAAARAAREAANRQPPPVKADDIIALSGEIDAAAQKARELARLSQRCAFLLVAQDLESIGERLAHYAAEFQR